MAQVPRGCCVEAEQAVAQVLTGLLAVETDGTVACVALTVLSPMRCLWGTWWISVSSFSLLGRSRLAMLSCFACSLGAAVGPPLAIVSV